MNLWNKIDGNGGRRYLNQEFGIPGQVPTWKIKVPRVILSEEFIFDEVFLYFRDNDTSLFAVNLESGEQLWSLETPPRSSIYFEGNKDSLLVASSIVSKVNRKTVFNFYDGGAVFPRRSSEALVVGGAIKEIDRTNTPGRYIFYNYEDEFTANLDIGLVKITSYEDGRFLLGMREGRISSYDWEKKQIKWDAGSFEGYSLTDINWAPAITSHNIFIYLRDEKFIAVLNKEDGSTVATYDLNGVDDRLDQFHMYYHIFSDETFHILTERRLLSFDSKTGSCLWKKELDLPKRFCGAGDIIFGIVNYRELVGWDRYTGEELWSVRLEDVPSSIKVSKRHLVVSSNGGSVTCFTWKIPYQSAYCPKS